jgi:hypothetical protein
MTPRPLQPVSGHVFRREGKRGGVWSAKYRLPDGQVQRRIGPAAEGRGRPGEGAYTERTAQARLEEVLVDARRGELPGMLRTGATFADAAAEFLRRAEADRALKPSTLRGYRSIIDAYLLPAFAERPIEQLTPNEIERWREHLQPAGNVERLSANTRNRIRRCGPCGLLGILFSSGRYARAALLPGSRRQNAALRHPITINPDARAEGALWEVLKPKSVGHYRSAADYLSDTRL